MKLSFKFELKENPYNDDSSRYLIWTRILLIIDSEVIIDYQWDILEVVEWFFSKREFLLEEIMFEKNDNLSIFEIRDCLYDSVDDQTSLDYLEKLENYFSNHIFRLKGTPLGTYYIGIFNNKLGQISFKKNDLVYSFDFDMNQFIIDTEKKIYDILKEWDKSPYKTIEGTSRIKDLQKEYPMARIWTDS